eukprot:gene19625-25535_t
MMQYNQQKVNALPIWTSEGNVDLPLSDVSLDGPITTPFERRFNPYDFNGGTTVCVAGNDFAIAAGCTRMSTGYQILSRNQSKLLNLSSKTVIAAAGCQSDITVLNKTLQARYLQYESQSQKIMSTEAAAQLLSVTLYYRRFFPYYAFCMIAGLDEKGVGAVFGYDAVGSFKRDQYGVMGSGQNFIMPFLDNLIGHKNRLDEKKILTVEEAISIVKTAFIVATERDIHTGDSVEINIITKDGIKTEVFDLKKD